MRPTSSSGWWTVVIAGIAICDTVVSSNPTTERSSGIRMRRARRLLQHRDRHLVVAGEDRRRPLGAVEELRRRHPPLEGAEVAVHLERRIGRDAGGRERGAVAARPVLRGNEAGDALDQTDPPVAEPEQVLGRLDRAGHVRGRDEREVPLERIRLVGDDERESLPLQEQEVLARLLGQHEDRAVDASLEQLVDERDLSLLVVERRAQDDLHVALVEGFGDPGDQLREVVAEHHRDRHADQPGASGLRGPGCPARREVELADHVEHRLARLLRDVGPVVEHARDRRDRHPRVGCDVPDRRASGLSVAVRGHARPKVYHVSGSISGTQKPGSSQGSHADLARIAVENRCLSGRSLEYFRKLWHAPPETVPEHSSPDVPPLRVKGARPTNRP